MNITLENAVSLFLVDQDLKGNSDKTIEYYNNTLGYFLDFMGKEKNVQDININDLNNYMLMLKKRPMMKNHPFRPKEDRPIKSISLQSYIRSIRSFLGWLYKECYIKDNLQKDYKLPKAKKSVIEILSNREIEVLLYSFNNKKEIGLRNLCIISLMLDSGLRRSEVINLNYDNIHITQGIIKVTGKGDKERIVPIGLYTKKQLIKYMNGFRSMPEYETKKLFIDIYKKPITENAIKQLFVRLRKKTGIERLKPHLLRHTFATKYLMNGGDIFSLQQILGHTSLDMVRRYSHLASSYIVHNYKKLSPLDNIYSNKYK